MIINASTSVSFLHLLNTIFNKQLWSKTKEVEREIEKKIKHMYLFNIGYFSVHIHD